jgi:polyisoprenoid-binding protein YceI
MALNQTLLRLFATKGAPTMALRPVLCYLFFSLSGIPCAQAVEYNTILVDKSSLVFAYKQMGVTMEGRFKKFAIQFSFDPSKPAAAKALVDLDLSGIDAGSTEANEEVAGKAWFNTKAFPQARFVATAIKPVGGNRYDVTGKLSIKGHTQEVNAPFTLAMQGNTAVFEGSFGIKRADFAIGEGVWADFGTIANEIQIKFRFLAAAGK